MPSATERVRDAVLRLGIPFELREFPEGTKTAADAARAVDCDVAQIAKSLVFRSADERAVLVITSGANRVDEARLGELLGTAVTRADADFVRIRTGFAIGGVAPVGHPDGVVTFVDRDLLAHDPIWAAAGTPHSMFPVAPDDLLAMSGGTVADIAQR
jgi:prolyl-tRNA editing enzyme YbaK/EbsC (Cys-tRNA(Pro) deacylase)